MVRNDSILAHGLTPVPGDLVKDLWIKVRGIVTEACNGSGANLDELYLSSGFPVLESHSLE